MEYPDGYWLLMFYITPTERRAIDALN